MSGCCNTTPGGQRRTAMLICHDCPHRRTHQPSGNPPDTGHEPVDVCGLVAEQLAREGKRPTKGVRGQLVVLTACGGQPTMGVQCPLGLHPDSKGVVRWRRLRWIGLPKPKRWLHRRWSAWLTRKPVITTEPEGCGCLLVLRRLAIELSPWPDASAFDTFGRGGPPWHASTLAEVSAWVRDRTRQTASTARQRARGVRPLT